MTPKGFRNKEEQVATEPFSRFTGRILAVLATLLMLAGEAYAASERVIYSFTGGADGGYPDSDLVMDRAGIFTAPPWRAASVAGLCSS